MKKLLCAALLALSVVSCGKGTENGRVKIGLFLANPVDVAFPNNETMYVSNSNFLQKYFLDASITIFDITQPTKPAVVGAVPTLLFNGRMAINQGALPNRLYVANRLSFDNFDALDQVMPFDISNPRQPLALPWVNVGDDPYGLDIVAAGEHAGKVLVPSISRGDLDYFNAAIGSTQAQTLILDVTTSTGFTYDGTAVSEVAVSPDGTRAVVTSTRQNIIYIIDLTGADAFTVEAVLITRLGGFDCPDFREVKWLNNQRFVAVNYNLNFVAAFDLSRIVNSTPLPDDTTVDQIFVEIGTFAGVNFGFLPPGGGATSLAVNGDKIYVSQYLYNQVLVLNSTSLLVTNSFLSGGIGPQAIRLHPAGRYLYIANSLSNSIGIVDTSTDTLVGTYP